MAGWNEICTLVQKSSDMDDSLFIEMTKSVNQQLLHLMTIITPKTQYLCL